MPFAWSINPYRGCEFGCRYCYARYTHEFMELRDSAEFEDKIYAKSNLQPILHRELKKIDGSKGISIGTATDPYQPAERRFERTRSIPRSLSKLNNRCTPLNHNQVRSGEARYRLQQVIGKRNQVSVNMTITTLDVSLARALEPRAPRPEPD